MADIQKVRIVSKNGVTWVYDESGNVIPSVTGISLEFSPRAVLAKITIFRVVDEAEIEAAGKANG